MLEEGEMRLIQCPSCGRNTTLGGARVKPKSLQLPTEETIALPNDDWNQWVIVPAVVLAFLSSGGLFVVGCMFSYDGLTATVHESQRLESSAIRQILYAVQYGTGFIVIALSLILAVLTGLLLKRH